MAAEADGVTQDLLDHRRRLLDHEVEGGWVEGGGRGSAPAPLGGDRRRGRVLAAQREGVVLTAATPGSPTPGALAPGRRVISGSAAETSAMMPITR